MAFEIFKMMGTIAINREEALRDIRAIKQGTQKASQEMGRSFTKFTTQHSAQFRKVGMVAAAAGAVISLAIKKVRGSFNEYESALVDMGKITDESLESIETRMKELPPILGNLTELTRGYYQIVSAGIKEPVEAVNTLTISAQTAAAAHMNQSEVVKGLTKVMAGYEGRIKTVSEAADLMFAIEKEGQTTVGELIPIIGSLATMASQLSISQDEMGASMAVITKTAGSTAEAATELEGVFTGLMKPTEEMKAVIKGMGFATAELAIEELGLVEVLRRIEVATGGSSEKLGELFGRKQAILGVSKLTAEGMKILSDTILSVAQKSGMAKEAYDDWTETGEALNEQTKAVTENLLILIGDALDPMMDKLQERLTGTITLIGEWIKENAELTASIAQWGGGLGMALVPFGALMMMMPGLVVTIPKIAAFIGILSAKFALLAVGLGLSTAGLGLLIVGLTAIGLYIGSKWKKALEEGKRIQEMQVKATEAQTGALEKLQQAYGLTEDEMGKVAENMREGKGLLDGILDKTDKYTGSVEDLAESERELAEAVKESTKSLEERDAALLNSIIRGEELSEEQEAYMALRQRMSDIDRTATQKKLDDLNRESIALIANMETNLMTMEQIDEYRKVMRAHIIAESTERQEHLRNMEDIEKRLFELTHTQTEVRIRDLEKERDARIEVAKQAMLSAEDLETAITEFEKIYEREKTIILELAIVRSEKEIATLDKAIELRKEQGELVDDLIKKRDAEIENLNNLEVAYGGTEEAAKKLAAAEAKRKVFKVVDAEGKVIGIRSQQQLSQEEAAAGVTLVPMMKGGLIQTFVNAIKHFAVGGGITDSVPIMATPGEYVIKKEMVDFIRKTGMVTGGLVQAIQKGLPTPSPGFAGGGIVGRWAGAQAGAPGGGAIWGSRTIKFEPGSINIWAKSLDDKTINEAGDKIFKMVHDKARDSGWIFGRG